MALPPFALLPPLTPTGASRVYQVERWFATRTENQLRQEVHRSTRESEDESLHRFCRSIHNRATGGPLMLFLPCNARDEQCSFVTDQEDPPTAPIAVTVTSTSIPRESQGAPVQVPTIGIA